ncbi:MAG: hypothetical protein FMNOHCHN_02711 [Ignavibacteriaceae bacterium]|nr:hypothetical protein [Ignavibacteriaceae bacterium]
MRFILFFVFFTPLCFAQQSGLYSPFGHHFNYISINQHKIWVSNAGVIGSRLYNEDDYNLTFGGFWPGGSNAYKRFIAENISFFVAGIVNDSFQLPPFVHLKYLTPGTYNSIPYQNNRVFKIRNKWESLPYGDIRNNFEKDFNEWPVLSGAPWEDRNSDDIYTPGIDVPKIFGDEMLWYVSHDAIPISVRLPPLMNDPPFGIEEQVSVFAFNRSNFLQDVVLLSIKLINQGSNSISNARVIFSQSFLQAVNPDNYPSVGIDTLQNLIYSYFQNNNGGEYTIPPAAGCLLLFSEISNISDYQLYSDKSPVPLMSFTTNASYDTSIRKFTDPGYKKRLFFRSEGFFENGDSIIDLVTNKTTKFVFPGDPLTNSGWTASKGLGPGLSKFGPFQYFTLGPVTFNPSDTIHIVLAVIAAQGTDNMNSLELLRQRAKLLKRAYENNFLTPPAPPSPEVKIYEEEGKVTLWWNDSAESYDIEDFMITGQNLNDTTYSFEGYRIWQFADSLGSDPREIALFDLVNGVTVIEDNIIANGLAVKAPVIIGKDNGIRRYISITKDIFSGSNLIPGLPYYFGVTAYSHNPFSSPSFTESPVKVYTVFPGRKKIDYSSPYAQGESIQAVQTLGSSNNAQVSFKIIDPASVKDGIYHITFSGNPKDSVYYSVTNTTTNELVLSSSVDFSADTLKKSIQQGWMVLVNDPDRTQMNRLPPEQRPFGISQIYSLSPSGQRDSIVNTGVAALGGWELRSNNIQLIDLYNNIGKSDYEIRFTAQGSQYYSSGYSGGLEFLLSNDPLAKGRVPFEVWDVTRGKRLKIKIYDNITPRDTLWTQRNSTKDWERFYCFLEPDGIYAEPLASSSGVLSKSDILFGEITLRGSLPPEGTVIRIDTYKQLMEGDQFTIELKAAEFSDKTTAQQKTGEISVYPNPYIASNRAEWGLGRVMRFTGLPEQAVIRIYTVAGRLVTTLRQDDLYNQYLDWNLTNEQGQRVAGGIYIAHVDMPGIGSKILKLAVIPEKEF